MPDRPCRGRVSVYGYPDVCEGGCPLLLGLLAVPRTRTTTTQPSPEVVRSAQDAYDQAGITDPRTQISLAEVHDCFTPDRAGSDGRPRILRAGGEGWKDVLNGDFELGGRLPVNPDGGLKSFGHPVGASGLRMLYEAWLQFRGEAGERQLEGPRTALTHNLGGRPGSCVSFVSVVGSELG